LDAKKDLVGHVVHQCREPFVFMPMCMVTPNSNPSTGSGSCSMMMRTTVAATELALVLSVHDCLAFLASLGSAAMTPIRSRNHSDHSHRSFLAALGQVAVQATLPLLQRLRAWTTLRGAYGGLG
jgi:hypothetical protein